MASLATNPASSGGPYRKPRASVYTVLLLVALSVLIAGSVCLYFECEAFNFEDKKEQAPTPPPLPVQAMLVPGSGPMSPYAGSLS
jgi:hypothetical protein